MDIVRDNLEVIRRVAKSRGVEDRVCATVPVILQVYTHATHSHARPPQVKTIYIESIADMQRALEGKVFDAVCAFGSMHHAPREFIQKQVRLLRDHLAPGGLWVQLAYPINRFRNPRPADNLPNMQAVFYDDGLSFNKLTEVVAATTTRPRGLSGGRQDAHAAACHMSLTHCAGTSQAKCCTT